MEVINVQKDIAVIGAGLTGLALGHYLNRQHKDFVLLEKKYRTGGVIATHQKDGFLYEAGPNTGVLGTPELAELFEENWSFVRNRNGQPGR